MLVSTQPERMSQTGLIPAPFAICLSWLFPLLLFILILVSFLRLLLFLFILFTFGARRGQRRRLSFWGRQLSQQRSWCSQLIVLFRRPQRLPWLLPQPRLPLWPWGLQLPLLVAVSAKRLPPLPLACALQQLPQALPLPPFSQPPILVLISELQLLPFAVWAPPPLLPSTWLRPPPLTVSLGLRLLSPVVLWGLLLPQLLISLSRLEQLLPPVASWAQLRPRPLPVISWGQLRPLFPTLASALVPLPLPLLASFWVLQPLQLLPLLPSGFSLSQLQFVPELPPAFLLLPFSFWHPFHLIFFWLRLQLLSTIVQLRPSLLPPGPPLLSFRQQASLLQPLQQRLPHLVPLTPAPGSHPSPPMAHPQHSPKNWD